VKEASEAYRHLRKVTKRTYMKVLDDLNESMRPIEINQLLALVDPKITSVAPTFTKKLPLLNKARAVKKEFQRLSKSKKQQLFPLSVLSFGPAGVPLFSPPPPVAFPVPCLLHPPKRPSASFPLPRSHPPC
jgi:hypothetical protein